METDATNPVVADDTAPATVPDDAEVDETAGFITDDSPPDDDGTPPEEPDEDEEFEVKEDLKIKVPKSVAEELRLATLRQSDYTKKTQEVAELRKAVEAEQSNLRQMSEAELNAYATAANLGQQIAAYSQFDWQGAMAQANANFDEDAKANIQAQFMRYQQLKDAQQAAVGNLHNLRTQRLSSEQQASAKLIEEGRSVLVKEIPGWNDELKAKLTEFAVGMGAPRENLADLEATPWGARILHAAYEGSAAKRAATKLANLAKDKQVQPAKVLRGTSGATPVSPATKDFRAFEKLAMKA